MAGRRSGRVMMAGQLLLATVAGHAWAWDEEGPLRVDPVPAAADEAPPPEPAAALAPSAPAVAGPPPEYYAGVFGGSLEADPVAITATYQCFLCVPVTASGTLDFSDGPVAGLRAGAWGRERWRHLGIAVELSHSQVSADQAKAEYLGVGVTPLLRWPLLAGDSSRSLQVAPYVGVLVAGINGGKVEVRLPALPAPLSGTARGRSGGVLAGVAIGVAALQLTLEYRDVSTALSMESFVAPGFDLDLDSRQTLLGLYYRR